MSAPCACDGFGVRKHKKNRCGQPTEKAMFVDVDIKPLPLCDDCWMLCWMAQMVEENGPRWRREYAMGLDDD